MAGKMEEKFSKYWQEYTPILSLVVVLDPRYKLKFVKFCFSKLDSLSCNDKTKVVEDNLHRLFKEYVKSPTSNSALVQSIVDGHDIEMGDEMDEFDLFESQPESSSQKTQLELYLEEPRLDDSDEEHITIDVEKIVARFTAKTMRDADRESRSNRERYQPYVD
uniref:Zinc finger BED domain-containing protein RICESLEEPER 2-like n=1 Tax=Nicotiana sylvestris TaxID=4096 RepID=A0A1U7XLZ7_NICSY|nr:PREDICTED: zinc finger BED domain-containing protein RICESLEEPER 2-like [Nicotiana sylvestris]